MKALLPALFLLGCASPPTVDISDRALYLDGRRYRVLTGSHVSGKPGSNGTPTGDLTVIAKEPRHRYGQVVRLGGVSADGFQQDGRGILIHRVRMSRSHTAGCVGLSRGNMVNVYRSLDVGDTIRVKM